MATTRINGIHNVAVPVQDLERAVGFYVGTLGFAVTMDTELQAGFRWIELTPPGSSTAVALVAAGPELPSGVDTGIRFSTTDAAADHAALTAAGADVDELLLWDGVPPMFDLRDLDGNTLYVTQIA